MDAKTRFLALSALVLGLAACASTPSPAPLGQTLARDPNLSTFNQLAAEAGLGAELGANGPLTVFAPSNAAFAQIPAAALEKLKADKDQLKAVLRYHLVSAKLATADVINSQQKTLQGANLALAKAGDFITVGEDAMVEKADVQATNGVAHIIDRVLMPPKK